MQKALDAHKAAVQVKCEMSAEDLKVCLHPVNLYYTGMHVVASFLPSATLSADPSLPDTMLVSVLRRRNACRGCVS